MNTKADATLDDLYRVPDKRKAELVETKNGPTGLRAVRARGSRIAGAFFFAVLSLLTTSAAQAAPGSHPQSPVRPPVTIERTVNADAEDASASLAGTIYDRNEAVIANADVVLLDERTGKKRKIISDEEGVFRVERLGAGKYTLTVRSPGFDSFKTQLVLNARESVRVNVTLKVAPPREVILLDEVTEPKKETTPRQGRIKPRR